MKKRIFTILFAIIVVIAISVPYVSAASAALTNTQKVSFTVECSKPGYEFSVYKIADLKTSTTPYSVKYAVKVNSAEVKSAVTDGNFSEADRAKILNALDKDTALTGASIVGTYKADTDGESKTFSNLAQGIYYVRATNYPADVKKVTNSAFALPYYTAENGWVYTLENINLAEKVDDTPPEIHKEITNSTRDNVNFTDVSIGDTVEFKIESSTVGAVNDVDVLDFKLNSYVITDIMSKGLTLNKNSFDLSLEDADDKTLSELAASDYTVSVTAEAGRDTNFTVSLKKAYLQKPEFYSADHVAVKFTAVLNKYATTEPIGNPNEAVKLTYANKNDVMGEVEGNKVFVYTYHIQVHKLDEEGNTLGGAAFELYKTEADAKAENNAIAAGTSDNNGLVVFYNDKDEEMLLESGKYYVKETKAPTGYNRYTDVIPVEIKVTYGDTLTNGTYIKNGPDLGLATVDVKNSMTVLPQTGGQGNLIIYTIAITLAVAGGVIFLIAMKKKKKHTADKAA